MISSNGTYGDAVEQIDFYTGQILDEKKLELDRKTLVIFTSDNVADKHPEVVKKLLSYSEKTREDIGDTDHRGEKQRPAAFVKNPKPLIMSKQ